MYFSCILFLLCVCVGMSVLGGQMPMCTHACRQQIQSWGWQLFLRIDVHHFLLCSFLFSFTLRPGATSLALSGSYMVFSGLFFLIYFIVMNSQIKTPHSQTKEATLTKTFSVTNAIHHNENRTVTMAILKPRSSTQDLPFLSQLHFNAPFHHKQEKTMTELNVEKHLSYLSPLS